MKELNFEMMENLEAGDAMDCVGAAAGLISLGILVAATPATGGSSLALAYAMGGAFAGGIGTGLSLGGCIFD